MSGRPSAVRRAVFAVALVSFSLPLTPLKAQHSVVNKSVITYSIPSLPLADAIAEFSRASGIAVRVEPGILTGKRSAPLSGRLAPAEALARLLEGSGLVTTQAADGTLVIQLRGASMASSTAPLPVMNVRGGSRSRSVVADVADLGVLGTASTLQTPFATNVVSRAALDAQQSSFLGEVVRNEPAAIVGNVPVGFVTLRGLAVSTDGFLYDGLPGHIGISDGRGQLEGVDRVEVLKGPSSFIYGVGAASSLGGTFNYQPKAPPVQRVRQVEASYAARTLMGLHVDLGDRVGASRQFGYRVNVAYKDGEQATRGYDWTHRVGTASVDWRAGRRLYLRANHEYAANDLPSLQPFFLLGPGVAVPKAPDARINIAQPWDDFRTRSNNSYVRADLALSSQWSLSAKALHNTHDRPAVKNARVGFITSNTGDVTLLGDQSRYAPTNTSAQLLLSGTSRLGSTTHRLVFGASGLRERSRNSAGATSLGAFATNLYAPVAQPEPAAIDVPSGITSRSQVQGVFVSDVVQFSDRFSALAGVRRANVEVTNYDPVSGQALPAASVLWATAPTAAVMFTPSSHAMLYANYAEGVEQGGLAPEGSVNENQRMPGLHTRQVELGGKLSVAGAMLSTALFELSRPLEYVDAATRRYVQNGEQRHRGIEAMLVGDLSPQLTLIGGAMWLDPVSRVTGDTLTDGKRPVGTPTHTANLWARYRVPALTGLSVNAGGYWTSAQYLDATNSNEIPGTVRFDVGAQFDATVGGTTMSYLLGVDNVTNRHYWSSAQSGLLTLSNPRTLKFTTRVAF